MIIACDFDISPRLGLGVSYSTIFTRHRLRVVDRTLIVVSKGYVV